MDKKNNFCFTFLFALIVLIFFAFKVEASERKLVEHTIYTNEGCPEGWLQQYCERKVYVEDIDLDLLDWKTVGDDETIKDKIKSFFKRFGSIKLKGSKSDRKPKIKQRKFFK